MILDVYGIPFEKINEINNQIKYLRPDSKSQVTVQYSDDNKPQKITNIVLSTQHDDFDNDEITFISKELIRYSGYFVSP